MPKVSVIIPTHNCAKYLPAALDSVLSQTYQDFEIVIVNDGSTDDTDLLIKRYSQVHSDRIKYYFQKNRGPAASRNNGIEKSEGEYIAFLDADDFWKPQKLEKQLAIFESQPEVGFVYCDNDFVDADGRLIENYKYEPILRQGDLALDLFSRYFIMTPSVVIRRACLDKIGYFRESLRVGEDYDLFLRLAYAFQGGVVKEKLWKRRVLEKSLSRRDFVMDAENDLATLKRFIAEHPIFLQKHLGRVKKRLSEYHFSFAYHALENGKNILAMKNLVASIFYRPSFIALKSLFLCFIPHSLRVFLKKKRGLRA